MADTQRGPAASRGAVRWTPVELRVMELRGHHTELDKALFSRITAELRGHHTELDKALLRMPPTSSRMHWATEQPSSGLSGRGSIMATTHITTWPSCEPTLSASTPPRTTPTTPSPATPNAGIEYGVPVMCRNVSPARRPVAAEEKRRQAAALQSGRSARRDSSTFSSHRGRCDEKLDTAAGGR